MVKNKALPDSARLCTPRLVILSLSLSLADLALSRLVSRVFSLFTDTVHLESTPWILPRLDPGTGPQVSSPSDPRVQVPRLSSSPGDWGPIPLPLDPGLQIFSIPTSQDPGIQVPSSRPSQVPELVPQCPTWACRTSGSPLGKKRLIKSRGSRRLPPPLPGARVSSRISARQSAAPPDPATKRQGSWAWVAFSIRYRIKGGGRLGKESIHPS